METITTHYFYDLSGRLAYCRNGRDEDYRYTYDQNNQVTKIENGNQFRKTETVYTYDKDGREKTAKTAAKTRQTAYDTLGRVQSHSWTGTGGTIGQVDYIYDPGANGSQSNQLQKMTYGSDAISYTYDNNGNITSIQTEDGTVTYEYDELYRLIREDNQILDQTIAYIYTFDGDLCRKKIYDYMPDTDLWMPQEIQPEETILYEYTADGLNLLTEYDGQTITYDAIGNPLQYRGMNLTWSNGRELYSASKNGTTTTYRYNKDGMRNRKYLGDGTVIYQIQGSLISGEQKIGQDEQSLVYELEYYYDSVGNILSMLYNGTEYYYLKNIQGDIIGILDGSGASVVEYSYDSWGKVIEISGDQELGKRNPFRYRGYYYDEETGFYYVSSRYYDPEVCRFINADTVDILGVQDNLNDKNLYAYCDNNPVMRKDTGGIFGQRL